MGELVKGMGEWLGKSEGRPKKKKRSFLSKLKRPGKTDLGKEAYNIEYEKARIKALRKKARKDAARDVREGKGRGLRGGFGAMARDIQKGARHIADNMESHERAGTDPFGFGSSRRKRRR